MDKLTPEDAQGRPRATMTIEGEILSTVRLIREVQAERVIVEKGIVAKLDSLRRAAEKLSDTSQYDIVIEMVKEMAETRAQESDKHIESMQRMHDNVQERFDQFLLETRNARAQKTAWLSAAVKAVWDKGGQWLIAGLVFLALGGLAQSCNLEQQVQDYIKTSVGNTPRSVEKVERNVPEQVDPLSRGR